MNMLLALSISVFVLAISYKVLKLEKHNIAKVRGFLCPKSSNGKEAPLVIGHRGGQYEAPENTLIAIRVAKSNGAAAVEIDLAFSEDGYAIIIHDETFDRTTDGSGEVSNKRFYEIRKLDASHKMKTLRYASGRTEMVEFEQIPTLKEVVMLCKDLGIKIILDVKSNPVAVSKFHFIYLHIYALVIGLPRKGDPGTTGGKSATIEEECTLVPGSFLSSRPFSCPRIGDIFRCQWVAAIVSVNMRLC